MGNIAYCFIVLTILISTVREALSTQIATNIQQNTPITNEWIFQFDILNKNDWDNYQITKNNNKNKNKNKNIKSRLLNENKAASSSLFGKSIKCTHKIPVIFKHLCVEWDHNNGFKLNLTSILPENINKNQNPKNTDLKWYYGTNTNAINAQKKSKHISDSTLWFNKDNHWMTSKRRSLIDQYGNDEKCYWYQGSRLCAQVNPQNNLLNAYVAVNDDNNNYFGAQSDYNNEYEYNDNDYMNDYISNYMNDLYSNMLSSSNYYSSMYDNYDYLIGALQDYYDFNNMHMNEIGNDATEQALQAQREEFRKQQQEYENNLDQMHTNMHMNNMNLKYDHSMRNLQQMQNLYREQMAQMQQMQNFEQNQQKDEMNHMNQLFGDQVNNMNDLKRKQQQHARDMANRLQARQSQRQYGGAHKEYNNYFNDYDDDDDDGNSYYAAKRDLNIKYWDDLNDDASSEAVNLKEDVEKMEKEVEKSVEKKVLGKEKKKMEKEVEEEMSQEVGQAVGKNKGEKGDEDGGGGEHESQSEEEDDNDQDADEDGDDGEQPENAE